MSHPVGWARPARAVPGSREAPVSPAASQPPDVTGRGRLVRTRERVLTGGDRLAKARERFLTAEPVEPDQVRDTILASWWRSRRWNVAADHIDLSYVRDPDLDTPLTRSEERRVGKECRSRWSPYH